MKMKKFKILSLLLFITNVTWAQTICGSNQAGDTPPGCVLCSGIFFSSTENYTAENFSFNSPCGKVENSQWISVRSDSEGKLSLKIAIGTCSSGAGVDVMLYTRQLSPISNCTPVFAPRGTGKVEMDGLNPGERYLLLIDGIDAAICEFSVEILTTAGMNNPPGGEPIELTPDSRDVCAQAIQRFSIEPVENADYYNWQLPFNVDVVSGGTIYDSYVNFRFSQFTSGSRTIQVTPELSCFSGVASYVSVFVHSLNAVTQHTVFVCPNDLPKEIEGIWVEQVGSYLDTILSETTGCPERLSLTVRSLGIQHVVLDTVICPGSCVLIGDSCYFENSNETISTPCLEVNQLNITHADTGDFKIHCFIDSFLNSIAFDWKNLGADSNDIFINDIYHTTQSGSSFFLNPSLISGDSIKFRVVPRSALGCPFKSSEIVCAAPKTSDISENDFEKKVKIFPNPTSDFIEIQTTEQIDELKIVDLSGKIQPITFSKKLNISHLNSGVYFLKIRIGGDFLIRKIAVF